MHGVVVAEARPLRVLHAATFLSSFDRLLVAPLLLPIARDLDAEVAEVALMATVYLVGYGLMQVVWGLVSDRLGRVRTMRLAMVVAGVAGVATALSPGLAALVVARLVAGGAYAAAVPGAITYIGDTVPAVRRHAPLTDLMTATALGMAAATLVGALLGDLLSWRVAFGVPAVAVLAVSLVLRGVPEPSGPDASRPASPPGLRVQAHRVREVLTHRRALLVLVLAGGEGMVLLGVITYLPTVLQAGGTGTAASGAATAVYGLAIVAFARLVKALSARVSPARLIAVGGAMGLGSYGALLVDRGLPGVVTASVLLAGAWAFMHSTMQNWATQVVPTLRATVVSLFASALFLGSAAWTALGVPFVARGDLVPYLLAGLLTALVLTAVATWTRHRLPG